MANQKDNAGVIVPPPLIFLGGLLLGGLISWFQPIKILPKIWGNIIGGVLTCIGVGIILIAQSKMAKAKTNIEPWKPTTAILSDGIYSISRNPVYLAMSFVYVGIVFIFNLLWMLAPIILVLGLIQFFVISREETYLEQKFGAEYLSYKEKVRRWI